MRQRPETVMGHVIPAPRVTRAGLRLFLLHVGAPLIGVLTAADVLIWAVGRYLFDTCIGVWCWF